MIHRPDTIGAFEFAVLSSLRAAQLCRGCVPRVAGDHLVAVMAQMEVAGGAVEAAERATSPAAGAFDTPLAAVQI